MWQRTIEESRAVTFHLIQFALEIVAGLFFLFLDYIIVSVLLVIRKNSEMTFIQEGEHTIHFSVSSLFYFIAVNFIIYSIVFLDSRFRIDCPSFENYPT